MKETQTITPKEMAGGASERVRKGRKAEEDLPRPALRKGRRFAHRQAPLYQTTTPTLPTATTRPPQRGGPYHRHYREQKQSRQGRRERKKARRRRRRKTAEAGPSKGRRMCPQTVFPASHFHRKLPVTCTAKHCSLNNEDKRPYHPDTTDLRKRHRETSKTENRRG